MDLYRQAIGRLITILIVRRDTRLQASEIRSRIAIMEWFPEDEYAEIDENRFLIEEPA
jgi:hypothetical protein